MLSGRQPIAERFSIGVLLGSGHNGYVYLGKAVDTGKEVAIKVESRCTRHPMLSYENLIYRLLEKVSGLSIPKVLWFCRMEDNTFLVMERLGPSLDKLLSACAGTFSLETVMKMAVAMLALLDGVHSSNIIHCSIKPPNFALDLKLQRLYIFDFGRAQKYRNYKTHEHIQYNEYVRGRLISDYHSLNSHLGIVLTRRDDLESLFFTLVRMVRGVLPWSGLRSSEVCSKMVVTPMETLCKDLPGAFLLFGNYVRRLRFEEQPDYLYLQSLFSEELSRMSVDTNTLMSLIDYTTVMDAGLGPPVVYDYEYYYDFIYN
jgi:serine/threonine protein kinase